LASMERSFQLDEMILRFLILQLDKKALAARAKAQAAAAAPPPEAAAPVPAREPLFKEGPPEKKP
ncbi:MAG TPA: hypothetical protein VL221_04545, partial [Bacteroidota bacterium]|nr:hypothetical protein [Bacteroidota bacterium]